MSTGSTAAKIAEAGIPVTKVEDLTGFPECLEGRVKTLHPRVHAGVLADTRKPEHLAQLEELGIEAFQLVIVNLYPFTQTVASGATPDECVEQIDIGGPSMVRAAAKNHPSVAVVVDPAKYEGVLAAVEAGGFNLFERTALAAQAFQHTASYDVAVATWMTESLVETVAPSEETDDSALSKFPRWVGATWNRSAVLRYGENPHQAAALYDSRPVPRASRRRSSSTARRCRTTTTPTVTPRGVRPTTMPSPRSRSSSTPTRVASRWAPTSPRRTARHTRAIRSPRSVA